MRCEVLTVPGLLRLRAGLDGHRPAVVTDEREISYAQLEESSAAIAQRLIAAGAAKGARVGLLMQNGIEWVCAAVAVMRIGAVLVPLSTFLRPNELEQQLRTAAASHLIVTDAFNGRDYLADVQKVVPTCVGSEAASMCEATLPSLRRVWPASELFPPTRARGADQHLSGVIEALEHDVSPADDMVIMFTSGSSGAPKGCIHTHASAIMGVATSLSDRGVTGDDRLYLPMPLFWTGGFGMGLMTALLTGCALLTEAIPEPGRTLQFISSRKATLFRGWPDQAVRIARHPEFASFDLSALRPGSLDALLPAHLRARATTARAGLLGMTETFGPYCCYPLDQELPEGKWGSAGRVQPHVEVQIVDPDTGDPGPCGRRGAIKVRGPNLLRGICGRMPHEVFDANGFYDTGDLGWVDHDGFLFYEGRRDDMVKVKGASVYPSEVERALQAIPHVARAFVTAVRSETSAETEIGAAVVPAEGCRLDTNQLHSTLRESLSAFKRPTRWLILSSEKDVPMLPSGKVDKRALGNALARGGI